MSIVKTYFPLLLILVYLLGGVFFSELSIGHFDLTRCMIHFMGGFFIIFSFFKFLNLSGFVKAYQTYDILAQHLPLYAWLYPGIELLLGSAYFFYSDLRLIYIFTTIIMTISSVGVIQSLMNKKNISCACLGTIFQLPMSKITLFEDLIMLTMALAGLMM